jgi:hypothetical protein
MVISIGIRWGRTIGGKVGWLNEEVH